LLTITTVTTSPSPPSLGHRHTLTPSPSLPHHHHPHSLIITILTPHHHHPLTSTQGYFAIGLVNWMAPEIHEAQQPK
jgi:hypothetical protein